MRSITVYPSLSLLRVGGPSARPSIFMFFHKKTTHRQQLYQKVGLGYALPLDNLVIPVTKSKFGACSFAVGGPSAGNALPESVRAAKSINIFKCQLKTHLFGLPYDT